MTVPARGAGAAAKPVTIAEIRAGLVRSATVPWWWALGAAAVALFLIF